MLAAGYTPEERESRLAEIEIARRILRDEQRRSTYDMLLLGFRQGLLGGGRLESLSHLQGLARADMAEERGEQLSSGEGAALLKQGLGYLNARLPREALDPLRRAVAALPRSPEAHAAYARAILDSDDPLALGSHMLRQALHSLDTLELLRAADARGPAIWRRCAAACLRATRAMRRRRRPSFSARSVSIASWRRPGAAWPRWRWPAAPPRRRWATAGARWRSIGGMSAR